MNFGRCLRRAVAGVGLAALLAALGFAPGAANASPMDPRVSSLASEARIPIDVAAQRIAWQDAGMAAIPGIARQLGSAFGGAWFDPGSGRLTVGVVRSLRAVPAAATFTSVVQAGLARVTDVVAVAWSPAELAAVTAALSPAIASLNDGAATAVTLRTVPPENAVEIVVGSGVLTTRQQAFIADAQRRFGSRVLVHHTEGSNQATPDACSGVHCDPPLRGGVKIDALGIGCTLGFIVRSNSDNKLYAITAGHCLAHAGGAIWRTRFADGTVHVIGPRHSHRSGGNLDAGLIAINNPAGWKPRAEVLVQASERNGLIAGTVRQERYAISRAGGSVFGTRVCKAGAFHGTSCGRVVGLNVTGPTGITGMGEATYLGGHGDSGAPIIAGHVAYGMHQSHNPPDLQASFDSFYVGIRGATAALNVHVATGT